jgi:hypothetical protein
VIKARQQGKRHFKLLILMALPLDQLFEATHMDTSELCLKLDMDDMNDIILVRQVLESAERVANGDEIEITSLSGEVRVLSGAAHLIAQPLFVSGGGIAYCILACTGAISPLTNLIFALTM